MLVDLSGPPANPSSVHWFGQQARNLLLQARRQTASYFGSRPEEVFFTSGGTEGINFLLRGLQKSSKPGHLVTTAIEHSAVYKTIQTLESQGFSVSSIPVGLWGAPLSTQIEEVLRPDTQAIVLSASNGETGVKIELDAIGRVAEKHSIPLILDTVAFAGKEPMDLPKSVSAASISAHKFHGPKGIGAVFVRPHLKLNSLLTGGNQEYGKRAGTENLAGILGLAEALEILKENQTAITQQLTDLRHHLERGLLAEIPDLAINGEGPRISNTSNIAFLGVDGETLLMHLDMAGIAVSHGSACSSGSLEPSRVLTQMGIDAKTARSSLRISIGRFNTREEIDRMIEITSHIVKKLRNVTS